MTKPILAGYDPRSADRAPVEFGVAAARFTGAPLIIACVEAAVGTREVVEADLVEDCASAIETIEAEVTADGVPVETWRLSGTSAARVLHRAAEEHEAGLLVVGSSRRSGAGRVLVGSTAERLLHGARCPIAVAPAGWTEGSGLHTIGVAYVDSPEAREALRGAHALARRAGASLRVFTVVKPGVWRNAGTRPDVAGQHGKDVEDVEGEHKVRAEQELRLTVAALGDDVPVEVEAFVGEPAETIVRVSEHLDLLVCGSRGYGPLRAVLLGSVTRQVLAEARCPVIVLPRGVEAALEGLLAETPGAATGA
jgi:nucleotide-binding universal stress UspA family protein